MTHQTRRHSWSLVCFGCGRTDRHHPAEKLMSHLCRPWPGGSITTIVGVTRQYSSDPLCQPTVQARGRGRPACIFCFFWKVETGGRADNLCECGRPRGSILSHFEVQNYYYFLYCIKLPRWDNIFIKLNLNSMVQSFELGFYLSILYLINKFINDY